MKLISLEFAAIGPYPTVQKVDFTGMEGLTLVCGSTGAGKTFIFDAITFALYGETSGGDRKPGTMRCTFADGATESYVKLVFEHNEHEYVIERRPEQDRLKQRGSGMMHQSEKVEFFLPDGRVLSKLKAVREEIESITGLTVEQWGQVVMLAQGKFRSFIDAKSGERGEILESIFGIGVYSRMQEEIAALSKDAEKSLDDAGISLAGFAGAISLGDIPEAEEFRNIFREPKTAVDKGARICELMDAIAGYDARLSMKAEEEFKDADQRASAAEKVYAEAKALHDSFEAFRTEEKAYGERKAEVPAFEERRRTNDRARDILMKVKPAEAAFGESKKASDDAKTKAVSARDEKARRADAADGCNAALVTAKSREGEMRTLREQVAQLSALLPKYDEADQKKKEMDSADKIRREYREKVESAAKKHAELEEEVARKRQRLTDTENSQADLVREKANEKIIGERIVAASALISALNAYRTAKDEESEAERTKLDAFGKWEAADREFSDMRRRFVLGQAGIIAGSLEEGKPCPVCGSLSHPRPAIAVDGCPAQADLDRKESDCKTLRAAADEATEILSSKQKALQNARAGVDANIEKSGIEVDPDSDNAAATVAAAKENLAEKRNESNSRIRILDAQCKEREQINREFGSGDPTEESQKALDDLKAEAAGKESEYSKVKGEYDNLSKDLKFRDKAALEARIREFDRDAGAIEKGIADATSAKSMADEALSAANATLVSAEENERNAGSLVISREEAFLSAVRAQGFQSLEDYRSNVRTEEQVKEEEKAISLFFEGLQNQSGKYEKAKEAIDGKTDPENLEELKVTAETLASERDTRNAELGACNGRMADNKEKMDQVRAKLKVIKDTMSQMMEIKELSDVATGKIRDKNGLHMSFSDYVRSKYFDSILARAEARLLHMTGGRYILRRSHDVSSGAVSHLLELEVVDNDSPDAPPRPVSSLSGGESFKAALALALGFSDAIQENAAGQRIDALFIDEGFGTLDEDESLDQAIDILDCLSGGKKTVCIISHVPKLRERIPRQIVVDYTNGVGSTMTVVKD